MEEAKSSASTKQTKPPFGSVKWYDDFFKLLQRIKIDKVDIPFLKTNEIALGNERKVINGLKFLDLIDENGNATDRMSDLSVVGDELTKNFEKMVRDAYSVLFSKVGVEKAKPDDVVNGLRINYDMALSTAKLGAKVFVFLAQKAKIPLSKSIAEGLEVTTRERKAKRKAKEPKGAKPRGKIEGVEKEGNYVLVPEGMIPLRYGNKFILFLQRGNQSTRKKVAKIAKQWIDTYVEEEESETGEK